jgi:hypothetical protein
MSTQLESPATDVPVADELRDLLQRAQAGDVSALAPLRDHVERAGLWEQMGDLSWHVEEALLNAAAGTDLLAKEAMRYRLAQLRAELAKDTATPLERLLVDRLVLCWAVANVADVQAQAKDQGADTQGPHFQRRLDAAHKRLLSAAKQLALVTKLLRRAPSPLQISTALAGKAGKVFGRQEAALIGGLAVEN